MRFFAAASDEPGARWHIDMHTAIRASAFEQFALLPHTGKPFSRAMFEWLGEARISAVLLHTTKGQHVFAFHRGGMRRAKRARSNSARCVRSAQNDLTRFAGADAGAASSAGRHHAMTQPRAMPRVFTVIDQITKQSDAFELLLARRRAEFHALREGHLARTRRRLSLHRASRRGAHRVSRTRRSSRVCAPVCW